MRKYVGIVVLSFLMGYWALSMSSCSSIDCPIQNKVELVCSVRDTLKDTLTVTTLRKNGKDSIILNKGTMLTSFKLPISHQREEDKLVFKTVKLNVTDTVWIVKEDQPHFESVDCGTTFFHQLVSVRSTHLGIDSVVITKSFVDYDSSAAHLLFYFKARP